ncbi:MAG TPA: flagellar hook capping FlgD N-terminal domain-containing protein [Vicinamibacterales bacterium]|jgi:flagellar basal-body rod modification protein FlgD
MAVNATGSATDPTAGTSTSNAASNAIGQATKGLGEGAFLQLLTTQLQNQNPLEPQDPTQFVAELAQFSSLDMLTQINTSVQGLGTKLGTPASTSTSGATSGSGSSGTTGASQGTTTQTATS